MTGKYSDAQRYKFARKVACSEEYQEQLGKVLGSKVDGWPHPDTEEEYDRQVDMMIDLAVAEGLYQLDAE